MKSNAEIAERAAQRIARTILEKHKRDGGTDTFIGREFLDDAKSEIESALTTAQ